MWGGSEPAWLWIGATVGIGLLAVGAALSLTPA